MNLHSNHMHHINNSGMNEWTSINYWEGGSRRETRGRKRIQDEKQIETFDLPALNWNEQEPDDYGDEDARAKTDHQNAPQGYPVKAQIWKKKNNNNNIWLIWYDAIWHMHGIRDYSERILFIFFYIFHFNSLNSAPPITSEQVFGIQPLPVA